MGVLRKRIEELEEQVAELRKQVKALQSRPATKSAPATEKK